MRDCAGLPKPEYLHHPHKGSRCWLACIRGDFYLQLLSGGLMPFYTPQPLVVEARQFKGSKDCEYQMQKWRGWEKSQVEDDVLYVSTEDDGYRETLESDWVIKYTE